MLVGGGVGFGGAGTGFSGRSPATSGLLHGPRSRRAGLCCAQAHHHCGCPHSTGGKTDRTEETGPLAPFPVTLQAWRGPGLSEPGPDSPGALPPAWPGRPMPLSRPIRVPSSRGRRGYLCTWTFDGLSLVTPDFLTEGDTQGSQEATFVQEWPATGVSGKLLLHLELGTRALEVEASSTTDIRPALPLTWRHRLQSRMSTHSAGLASILLVELRPPLILVFMLKKKNEKK